MYAFCLQMCSFNINLRLNSGCILTGIQVFSFGYLLAVFSEIDDNVTRYSGKEIDEINCYTFLVWFF